MKKPVARLGDSGSHGGSIITATSTITVNGRSIALVDDIYDCPKHGKNPIITGANSVYGQGKFVAHVDSKTACGAVITSGSPDTFVDDQAGENFSSISMVTEFYDEQIIAVDSIGNPIPYYPFYIEIKGDHVLSGRTNENGETPRVKTSSKEDLYAYWGEDAILKGAS